MASSRPLLPRKDRVPHTARQDGASDQPDRNPDENADQKGTNTTWRNRLMPSPDATTNLLIADIIVRSASSLFRKSVERRVAKASTVDDEDANALVDGSTLIKSLALYGASKVATRSPLGLGLIAGGLALKTLYDRGKASQRRQAIEDQRPPKPD